MALKFEKSRLMDAQPGDTFALGEIINVRQLVTWHELKKKGIDPASLPLEATTIFHTKSLIAQVPTVKGKEAGYKPRLVYPPSVLEDWDAEDFYVILAHETAHITQPAKKIAAGGAAMASGTIQHKDEPMELDAQIWEARQAAKFEWDDERYRLFVDRLYAPLLPDLAIERLQTLREEAEERPTSFATMRRRVKVRGYVRRGRR